MRVWTKAVVVWMLVLSLGVAQVARAESTPPSSSNTSAPGKYNPARWYEFWKMLTGQAPDEQLFAYWLSISGLMVLPALRAAFTEKGREELGTALKQLWGVLTGKQRREFREWTEHLKNFTETHKGQMEQVNKAAETQAKRERKISAHLALFQERFESNLDARDRRLLRHAIQQWDQGRDLSHFESLYQRVRPQLESVDTYRRWQQRYELYLDAEMTSSAELLHTTRALLTEVDKADTLGGNPAKTHVLDQPTRTHEQGRLHWDGKSLRATDVTIKLRERCDAAFKALTDKMVEAESRRGVIARASQTATAAKGIVPIAISSIGAFHLIRSTQKTMEETGLDPFTATQAKQEQDRVRAAAKAIAETTFDSQLVRFQKEIAPYTSQVEAALKSHKDSIIAAALAHWQNETGLVAEDIATRTKALKELFETDSALHYELLQAIVSVHKGEASSPDASQVKLSAMGSMGFPEFQAFLALAPTAKETAPYHSAFTEQLIGELLRRHLPVLPENIQGQIQKTAGELTTQQASETDQTKKVVAPKTWVEHLLVPKTPPPATSTGSLGVNPLLDFNQPAANRENAPEPKRISRMGETYSGIASTSHQPTAAGLAP